VRVLPATLAEAKQVANAWNVSAAEDERISDVLDRSSLDQSDDPRDQ
jgi:hypothetical protein